MFKYNDVEYNYENFPNENDNRRSFYAKPNELLSETIVRADPGNAFEDITLVFEYKNAGSQDFGHAVGTQVKLTIADNGSGTLFSNGQPFNVFTLDQGVLAHLPTGTIIAGQTPASFSMSATIDGKEWGTFKLAVNDAPPVVTPPDDEIHTHSSLKTPEKTADLTTVPNTKFPVIEFSIFTSPDNDQETHTPVEDGPQITLHLSQSGTGTQFFDNSFDKTPRVAFNGTLTLITGYLIAGSNKGTETLTLSLAATSEEIGSYTLIVA